MIHSKIDMLLFSSLLFYFIFLMSSGCHLDCRKTRRDLTLQVSGLARTIVCGFVLSKFTEGNGNFTPARTFCGV